MVMSVPEALATVSKYAVETRSKLNTSSTQRRNAIYNSFGQERSITLTPNVPGLLYLPITTDLSSFIRWNFKLVIRPLAGVTVDPTFTKFKIAIDGLDVTDLFQSQWALPKTTGIYPNKTMGDFYDIIRVCDMLSDLDTDTILNGGMHVLQIETDAYLEVTLLEFVSYSFIARHGQSVNVYTQSDMEANASITGPIGGGGETRVATLKTLSKLSDLNEEQQTLETELENLSGSRANQFIQAATINTRLYEIANEKEQIEQLEELQNGREQIIE